MTLEDTLLNYFDNYKILSINAIHKLVKANNIEIANALKSLEKQGMIRPINLKTWQRTNLDSINDWL